MIVIHPDGRFETVPYVDYTSVHDAVNPPGRDDAFRAVPLPESYRGGYTVYVNDMGLLINLPVNPFAEQLCLYTPLVGPAVVVTHEEGREYELADGIVPELHAAFNKRLGQVILMARNHVEKLKSGLN